MKNNKFKKIKNLNKIIQVILSPNSEKFYLIRKDIDLIKHNISRNKILIDFSNFSPLFELNDDVDKDEDLNENKSIDVNFIKNDEIDTEIENEIDEININFDDDEIENKEKEKIENFLRPIKCKNDSIRELIKSNDFEYDLLLKNLNLNKYYDFKIFIKDFETSNEFTFNVHKSFLKQRLGESFKSFEKNDYRIEINELENSLSIFGSIPIKSVAIFLHYLYTDEILDIWNDYPINKLTMDIKRTKTSFEKLFFRLNFKNSIKTDLINIFNNYTISEGEERERESYNDDDDDDDDDYFGDIKIELKDNIIIKTFKYLLISRSCYFKTLFSNRWDNSKVIKLNHIDIKLWEIIIKFFSGIDFLNLFNNFEINNIESFINFNLDLLEISNELIILDLKDYCELFLKDFITFENYYLIISHAYNNKAWKLFENCVWYIYNNLNLILFDENFKFDDEIMLKIEVGIKKFNNLTTGNGIANEKAVNLNNFDIKLFIENPDAFNGEFLHPLLWDSVGPFFKEENDFSRRSSSIKLTRSENQVENNYYNDENENENENENAIADDDENINHNDGFIVVTKNRRSSSKLIEHPIKLTEPLLIIKKPARGSNTWINDNNNTNNINTNNLIKQIQNSPSVDQLLQDKKPKQKPVLKATSTNLRISQKERKRQIENNSSKKKLEINNEKLPWSGKNGWTPINNDSLNLSSSSSSSKISNVEPSTAILLSQNKLNTVHFPSIEEKKKVETISFESVLIQERVNKENKNSSRQGSSVSLDDIKQEEEFAKWWSEESERIQKQMKEEEELIMRLSGGSGGGGNRGRGGGRGRGRRQSHGRGKGRGRGGHTNNNTKGTTTNHV